MASIVDCRQLKSKIPVEKYTESSVISANGIFHPTGNKALGINKNVTPT